MRPGNPRKCGAIARPGNGSYSLAQRLAQYIRIWRFTRLPNNELRFDVFDDANFFMFSFLIESKPQ